MDQRGPDYLTVTQASVALGVTRRAVLFAIQRGRLSATRYGHAWLIERAAVDAYAAGRTCRRR